MTSASEQGEQAMEATGGSIGLRGPLLITAALAAGAGIALGTKALLDARRNGSPDEESGEDLPSVLRRAGLDVAIAATSQAAERLTQNGEAAPRRS